MTRRTGPTLRRSAGDDGTSTVRPSRAGGAAHTLSPGDELTRRL